MKGSIIINVPFEYVVGYAGDVKNYSQWAPTFVDYKLVNGEFNEIGSMYECYHLSVGRSMLTKNELTEVNSTPELFVMKFNSSWFEPDLEKDIGYKKIFTSTRKEYTTEVTYEIEFEDIFKDYKYYNIACMTTENEIEFSLKNLKILLENFE